MYRLEYHSIFNDIFEVSVQIIFDGMNRFPHILESQTEQRRHYRAPHLETE